MKHKLDLLGNAVDSLNQGLKLYIEGRDGTVGAYKFAVLHLSHYLELLFKHAVGGLKKVPGTIVCPLAPL